MSTQVNLGLTFYGGVSLAVFEAGIAYELVRATQFSRLANRPHGVPQIHVDVVTGTSAGGLAAVQLAAALSGTNTEGVLAKLVSIWANDADIQSLLPEASFDGQGFLDNGVLRRRARDVLETASQTTDAGRLEDDLDVILTLTNLSGLREPVILAEDATAPTFPTTRHVEYERFRAEDVTDPQERDRFVDAAVITAGFPVAFPPALKPSSQIAEDKPDDEKTRFVYIDGGVMDNRPLGVALDTIAEKPAPQRLFLFIDPNETWVPPSHGAADAHRRRIDPAGIYLQIGGVARSDSIFQDLERLRGLHDTLSFLEPLSERVFADEALRQTLIEDLYPRVVERRFNPQAWALWLLVRDVADDAVRAQWEQVRRQDRFALRARLHEFIDRFVDAEQLDRGEAAQIKLAIDTAPGWQGYYRALRDLRRLDRDFQELRYRLWHEHFANLPRHRLAQEGQPRQALPDGLQEDVRAVFARLATAAAALREERTKVARELLDSEVLRRLKAPLEEQEGLEARFYDYAHAMQALEALAGIRSTPNLSVRRITPFDIYADTADLDEVQPLAGGALGAFGGFLDKRWRINDFLVGRLAMRVQLRREGLIPEDAIDAYRSWSAERDADIITRLAPGSSEAQALQQFATIELKPSGIAGDVNKPTGLLDRQEMQVEALPGSRLARIVRKLLGSTRRILRLNGARLPYRPLRMLTPALWVTGALIWILEQSLRPAPHADGDTTKALLSRLTWYLAVLGLGIALGVALTLLVS